MPVPLIVVVDDYQPMVEFYTNVLEYHGYRVLDCRSEREAVACVQRDHPQVVILDTWLGGAMGGWKVFQALAKNSTTASIPVIMCGDTDAERFQQPAGLSSSPVDFLSKPFRIDELLTAVERALAVSTY